MTFETNKMAQKVQEALIQASALAERHRQSELEPEHLLLVMLGQTGGIIPQMLTKLAVPIDAIMAEVRRAMLRFPSSAGEINLTVSHRLRYLLLNAQEEAERFGDPYVSGEHILLALVVSAKGKRGAKRASQSGYSREAGDIFLAYGVNQDVVLNILEEIRRLRQSPQASADTISALNQYGRNLVLLAREGGLDPVVGREEEISMIIQVLTKTNKNNPILVGGSGVGKTSVVEGLAQCIVRGEVPSSFYNKDIVALDKEALLAGVKTRGDLEERFKAVLKDVIDSPSTVLFIDDLETILGSTDEGNLDFTGIFMPILDRFELQFIGTCSQEAFDNLTGRIPNYANYFQPVVIKPSSVDATIMILHELRQGYENHHGVSITDDALVAASVLSNKYITDRNLPEKAIDLIDEAAARLRMEMRSDPMDQAHMNPSHQPMGNDRQMHLPDHTNAKEATSRLRNKIEEVQGQIIQAQESFDTLRAADLQFCTLPNLEAELALLEQKAYETGDSQEDNVPRQHGRQVTEEDIQAIVSQYVGIPADKIIVNPAKKLNNLEQILGERIIGQNMAIDSIANAIRRSRGRTASPNRPLGSFLFLGQSGVGKTAMAKALADTLYGSDLRIARLDLSMYADQDAVVRLIGDSTDSINPEPGHLIEIMQEEPEIVLILESIEKAHIDVQSLLQQIMEDGFLSDSDGQVLSFCDTVIVMKSGIGADIISQMPGRNQQASILPSLQAELSHFLREEFLVSLDEIVIFETLGREELIRLIDLNLVDLKQRMEDKGLTITITEGAYMRLIEDANPSVLGARLLKSVVQRKIQNPIAIKTLQGQFGRGAIYVEVSQQSGEIIFTPG